MTQYSIIRTHKATRNEENVGAFFVFKQRELREKWGGALQAHLATSKRFGVGSTLFKKLADERTADPPDIHKVYSGGGYDFTWRRETL